MFVTLFRECSCTIQRAMRTGVSGVPHRRGAPCRSITSCGDPDDEEME